MSSGFRYLNSGSSKAVTALLLLVSSMGYLYAAPGDAGAAFLKIPVDAQIVGMGEASAGRIDNSASLYYNPAGLADIASYDVRFTHNMWLLGMNHEYLAGAFNAKKIGTFGASFNYWGSGSIQGVTIRGDTIPGYRFSASNWVITAGYGKNFGSFSGGIDFKYLSEKNESFSTSTFGFDIGGKYKAPVKGLAAGLSFSNIGGSITLDQDAYPLPMLIRLGWQYQASVFRVAQDFVFSNSDDLVITLGGEYLIAKILALRLGYRNGPDYEGFAGIRAGIGIKAGILGIDYAVAPYGQLGMTHRFSISFGK